MKTPQKKNWQIFRIIALIITIPALISALAFLISYFGGRRTIDINGTPRAYHLYIPPASHQNTPMSLVLVYHMRQGNAWLMQEITRFNRVAKENHFIVAYPDGYRRSWADGSGRYEADQAGYDDIAFTTALIQELTTQHNIDPHQVYGVGFSNGGFLIHRLGCQMPGVFAGLAAVSALLPKEVARTCTPSQATPTLMIHGSSDLDLPWSGKSGLLSVPDTLARWLEINNCETIPQTESWDKITVDNTSIRRETYSCQKAPLIFYEIQGGGHRWPGGSFWQYWLSGSATQELNASELIWDFFEQQNQ